LGEAKAINRVKQKKRVMICLIQAKGDGTERADKQNPNFQTSLSVGVVTAEYT